MSVDLAVWVIIFYLLVGISVAFLGSDSCNNPYLEVDESKVKYKRYVRWSPIFVLLWPLGAALVILGLLYGLFIQIPIEYIKSWKD